MKKKITNKKIFTFIITLITFISFTNNVNAENICGGMFNDLKFYREIINEYNKHVATEQQMGYEACLSSEQLETITKLSVSLGAGDSLNSIKGIEYMPNLKEFVVDIGPDSGGCQLSSTSNPGVSGPALYIHNNLKKLDLAGCKINSINLDMYSLEELYLYNSGLTSFQISGLSKLKKLNLFANKLTSLNLSGASNLTHLNLSLNRNLTSVNLSGASNLKDLNLSEDEKLTSIDLSNNYKLQNVNLLNVPITNINLTDWRYNNGFNKFPQFSLNATNDNGENILDSTERIMPTMNLTYNGNDVKMDKWYPSKHFKINLIDVLPAEVVWIKVPGESNYSSVKDSSYYNDSTSIYERNITQPGTIYLKVPGVSANPLNTKEYTYTITKIDSSSPTNNTTQTSYNRDDSSSDYTCTKFEYNISASDDQSGIRSIEFFYDGAKSTLTSNKKIVSVCDGPHTIITRVYNNAGSYTDKTFTVTGYRYNRPTITVSPSGWASAKELNITGTATDPNAKLQYNFDGTWKNAGTNTYASSWITNDSVIKARMYKNDNNYGPVATMTITQIDRNNPSLSIGKVTSAADHITIPYNVIDSQSGVKKVMAYYGHVALEEEVDIIDNAVGSIECSNNKCEIPSATTDQHYYYLIKATDNVNNSSIETGEYVRGDFEAPVINVTPGINSYSSKKYFSADCNSGLDCWYQINSEEEVPFDSSISNVEITRNSSIKTKICDEVGCKTRTTSITTIDSTAPININLYTSQTSKSITITASASDPESGIYGYKFSKDDGKTWTDFQTSNVYTFTGLGIGTYKVKVRVYNNSLDETNGYNPTTNHLYKDSSSKDITLVLQSPTITIEPMDWSKSKVVTISYQSGNYTKEYSYDGATWYTYNNLPMAATRNTTIWARINDGVNYITTTKDITTIDTTAPTSAEIAKVEQTSSSITITASGTDPESGITMYQYSKDDGATWSDLTDQKMYTFTGLSAGEYKVKVKVVNGTYSVDKLSDTNSKISLSKTVTILPAPIIVSVTPDGLATKKTVTINYNDSSNKYSHKYRINGGSWNNYTEAFDVTTNGTLEAKIEASDSSETSSATISGIDRTAPSLSINTSHTLSDITVTANASDSESGIKGYKFSKDDGATWTSIQDSNTYTFSDLTLGTYKIKVKAINKTVDNSGENDYNTKIVSETVVISLPNISYEISPSGYSQSKTLTINYPEGFVNTYSDDNQQTWKNYTEPIILSKNTKIYAKITTTDSSKSGVQEINITQIDNSAPTVSMVENYSINGSNITVTAAGIDVESLICQYQYKIDDNEFTEPTSNNVYTFENLSNGKHNVVVRVINGTYANEGLKKNYLDSQPVEIEIIPPEIDIPQPVISVEGDGWTKSKKITISYEDGYDKLYSFDKTTWKEYTNPIIVTSNMKIYAKVTDGYNETISERNITQIDKTAPTKSDFTTTNTDSTITVVAEGFDNENGSGIQYYQFSKDNGKTWTEKQLDNTYLFENLTDYDYTIKVRVLDKVGNYKDSEGKKISIREKIETFEKKDEKTGISLSATTDVITKEIVLNIRLIAENSAEYKNIYNAIANLSDYEIDNLTIYDINLLLDNKKVQPNGLVTLNIPKTEKFDFSRTVLLRREDDGKLSKLDYKLVNDNIQFQTNHFSYYMIVTYKDSVADNEIDYSKVTIENPRTGINNKYTFGILLIIVSMIVYTFINKKKIID